MSSILIRRQEPTTGKYRVEIFTPNFARSVLIAIVVFLALGVWQFMRIQNRPVDDFYQPHGYIRRVNNLIQQGKLYARNEKTPTGYRMIIRTAALEPGDDLFYRRSWLKSDIDAFNEGNSEVFLIENGKLRGINIYRHRIESPLSSDWSWWGRIYSSSSEGYAYLWNSRRTLKLYRPPLQQRASAKAAQSEFREVVYGRGQLFQTGYGITIKGRYNNRIADVYAMGDNIVLKSYGSDCCFINGHEVPKGSEQRLEEGDLIQMQFSRTEREEFLFHDFSRKPLSFVNVLNGRQHRTTIDTSFQIIAPLTSAIETSVKKTKDEKKAAFDLHLALDEDLSGLTQNSLNAFSRQLSTGKVRASCTVMNALNGRVLAIASTGKRETNENLKLHPVGSSTKIFLAAAATQSYPDLLDLKIDPHPVGEEKELLGYPLQEGYKLRNHSPFVGEEGTTDFSAYIAKSCNRYHAVLMALSLARDTAVATGKQNEPSGIAMTADSIDQSNGSIYLHDDVIDRSPDLGYFVSKRANGVLECNNLESSELALNLERLFGVKRKWSEGSGDFFSPDPWNSLFARLGLQQRSNLYPAFYGVMPETVNLGFNLNIDFRLDFISILFGGATNRWNNIKLAEATSRLVTDRKVNAKFIEKISDGDNHLEETAETKPLEMNPTVRERLLDGMAAVAAPGGTAGDLWPILQDLKLHTADKYQLEFYGKTGTPFRREIRKGATELYSSIFLMTAVLRDTSTNRIEDALTFAIYIEDQGEHKAIDFMKQVLPRVLAARGWIVT